MQRTNMSAAIWIHRKIFQKQRIQIIPQTKCSTWKCAFWTSCESRRIADRRRTWKKCQIATTTHIIHTIDLMISIRFISMRICQWQVDAVQFGFHDARPAILIPTQRTMPDRLNRNISSHYTNGLIAKERNNLCHHRRSANHIVDFRSTKITCQAFQITGIRTFSTVRRMNVSSQMLRECHRSLIRHCLTHRCARPKRTIAFARTVTVDKRLPTAQPGLIHFAHCARQVSASIDATNAKNHRVAPNAMTEPMQRNWSMALERLVEAVNAPAQVEPWAATVNPYSSGKFLETFNWKYV